MFYNIDALEKKAFSIYKSGEVFRAFMEKKELFPLHIKLKTIKQSSIQNSFLQLQYEFKNLKAKNLNLIYKEFHFKSIGTQKLPVEVQFDSRDVYLKFIGKKDAFDAFVQIYVQTKKSYPELENYLAQKPFFFLEQGEVLERLFLVCSFFLEHPKPNIYLRELSISGVDTKFIEKNKKALDTLLSLLLDRANYKVEISKLSNNGFEKKYYLKYDKPLVRFRILDETQTLCGLGDLSLPIEKFKELTLKANDIFIVENKMTMLSFPLRKNAMVIFGSGYAVSALRDVSWLHEKNIYYWGDIDSDGFAILSQIRMYFPHVSSFLMDEETFTVSKTFSEPYVQQYKVLSCLKKEEENMYKHFACHYRLEQEKIPFSFVTQKLKELNYAE